jgi:hypothetical protein
MALEGARRSVLRGLWTDREAATAIAACSRRSRATLLIDGQCERLGYPADLYVQVLRADTRAIVAEIDDPALTDIPASIGRFYTRTDDPRGG